MLNHFKNTIMICTHCHHEMSRKHHSAGNTGSKWRDRALAAACLIGGALGTAIIPGPGRATVILGAQAARNAWNGAENNYDYWHCSHCGKEVRISD